MNKKEFDRLPSAPPLPELELGKVVMTSGVIALLAWVENGTAEIQQMLKRHRSGDWGNLDDEDKAANDRAADSGDARILSAYELFGGKVWIITEWDRSVTTILLPSEY